jgi:hypothetical protein
MIDNARSFNMAVARYIIEKGKRSCKTIEVMELVESFGGIVKLVSGSYIIYKPPGFWRKLRNRLNKGFYIYVCKKSGKSAF